MNVFKFGGASISSADSMKNIAKLIADQAYAQTRIVNVISAIGKTTNALEQVVRLTLSQQYEEALSEWHAILAYHLAFLDQLAINDNDLNKSIEHIDQYIKSRIIEPINTHGNFLYDQIVSQGEVLSTKIIATYFHQNYEPSSWVDARTWIKTDSNYTDANIDWKSTQEAIQTNINTINTRIVFTQGFLGGTPEGFYTTLGREGSDFSAAIIASSLVCDRVTIWKDVLGVYNADPKLFDFARLMPKISYQEAIEMTYYGAQVIHPKTIKPLKNKKISLHVRSFLEPKSEGTIVADFDQIDYPPIVVYRENQVMYRFQVKDFSFLDEANLGKIIATFSDLSYRIKLIQATAIDLVIVADEKVNKTDSILDKLQDIFTITLTKNIKLLTIRHANQEILERLYPKNNVLITQKTSDTIQFVLTKA
ncbi:MAG: aspartate kinase [Chitinophagales bacterium]|jgi:aspartate kinase|nr:aspartate kinase [Chitinophagales bacterium]